MSAMSAEGRAYLDTSAVAKWYLNEDGSDAFVAYIKGLDVAVISSLTRTKMSSLLARPRRMGDLDPALESVIFATFLDDIAGGFLSPCPTDDRRLDEAVSLIARYQEHPLRTLDALHLAIARHEQVDAIATADGVMADTAEAMGFAVARF
jgi:predicted nucleic acid-binding protein